MYRAVLIVHPHGNIRRQLWQLKQETFDWQRDDLVMALPEGFICGWFSLPGDGNLNERLSNYAFSERAQEILNQHAEKICAILPDTFHFNSVSMNNGLYILKLEDIFDNLALRTEMERLATDLGIVACADLITERLELPVEAGICLGRGNRPSVSEPLSFKKYELMIYLAELPETPFSGFQFRTIARIHRKVQYIPRNRGKTAVRED